MCRLLFQRNGIRRFPNRAISYSKWPVSGTIFIVAEPDTVESPSPSESKTSDGALGFEPVSLTPEVRWQRICQILHRAACRTTLQDPRVKESSSRRLTDDQQRLLGAIQSTQAISPEKLLVLAPMSRSSLTRGLKALRAHGLVERNGKTHQAIYTVSAKQRNVATHESRNDCKKQPESQVSSRDCAKMPSALIREPLEL